MTDANSRPWELKETKRTHCDGQPGNFTIYRERYEELQVENGRNGSAVYRICGRVVQALETIYLPASRLQQSGDLVAVVTEDPTGKGGAGNVF